MDPNMLRSLQSQFPYVALPIVPGRAAEVVTGPVRLAFAYLDRPKPNKLNPAKKPEFTSLFVIPPGSNMTALLQTVDAVAGAKFGPNWRQVPNLNTDLKSQARMVQKFRAKGKDLPGFSEDPNAIYLDAASEFPPALLDLNKLPTVVSKDQTGIYAGCWVRAHLRVYAYPKDNAPAKAMGIGLGLISVMKIADDEMFRGNVSDPGAAYDTPAHASAAAPAAPVAGAPHYAPQPPAAPAYQQPQYQAPQPAYAPQPQYAPHQMAPAAAAPQPAYQPQYAPQPAGPMTLPGFGPQQ